MVMVIDVVNELLRRNKGYYPFRLRDLLPKEVLMADLKRDSNSLLGDKVNKLKLAKQDELRYMLISYLKGGEENNEFLDFIIKGDRDDLPTGVKNKVKEIHFFSEVQRDILHCYVEN